MVADLALDPVVVGVVAAMAAVTYATKAAGLWLLGGVDLPERARAGLEATPGAIVVALLGPELAGAGPPEWGAGAVAVVVAWRTDSLALALATGILAVLALRGLLSPHFAGVFSP
ncbi:AzlD family protein [Halorientalis marina]|jgi:uncharacterized membrane protein|uniref:AzlD family protein n=1 Tax=Halorientalis marina TaxID=2931976 RepID=UPI001FF2D82C|nr:AzlD domain-containing protein [Halorientalis marina]